MNKKITLKQIAQELDVSISTVSKALSNSREISLETKEKIQAFARLYNYKPNNIAVSLQNRKTKTIGVIVPEIVDYFFSKVISGIEEVASHKGYSILIGQSNDFYEKEVLNMKMLANGSIDGFILSVAKETFLQQNFSHFYEAIDDGMPIVMFDRVIDRLPCDKVFIDDTKGAYNAVSILIENGCKSVGIITTKDYVNVGRLRSEGYLKAMNDHKMELSDSLILKVEDCVNKEENLYILEREIEAYLIANPDIDGLLAVNELYAIVAMNIARKLKMNIPKDLQVIGFTDGQLSKLSIPTLTVVSQNAQRMGEKAAELLINRLEGDTDNNNFKTKLIHTELIVRDSTR